MIKTKENCMARATPSLENYKVFGFFQNKLFTTLALTGASFFVSRRRGGMKTVAENALQAYNVFLESESVHSHASY